MTDDHMPDTSRSHGYDPGHDDVVDSDMLWWVSSLNNRGRDGSGIVAGQDECLGVADGGCSTDRVSADGLVDSVDQDAEATGVGSGEYSGLRVVGDADAGADSAGGDGDESDDGVGVASAESWEAVRGALHDPGEVADASGRGRFGGRGGRPAGGRRWRGGRRGGVDGGAVPAGGAGDTPVVHGGAGRRSGRFRWWGVLAAGVGVVLVAGAFVAGRSFMSGDQTPVNAAPPAEALSTSAEPSAAPVTTSAPVKNKGLPASEIPVVAGRCEARGGEEMIGPSQKSGRSAFAAFQAEYYARNAEGVRSLISEQNSGWRDQEWAKFLSQVPAEAVWCVRMGPDDGMGRFDAEVVQQVGDTSQTYRYTVTTVMGDEHRWFVKQMDAV
ncbi:hypothetical protein [Corynebacterium bovis]|uniref:hypothetical protein n=1 Tax=Corynebacterium bovis TaxID=36808 RepID=UPI000F647750|nr:hypothetical protein [Corynebacterium bovis]